MLIKGARGRGLWFGLLAESCRLPKVVVVKLAMLSLRILTQLLEVVLHFAALLLILQVVSLVLLHQILGDIVRAMDNVALTSRLQVKHHFIGHDLGFELHVGSAERR